MPFMRPYAQQPNGHPGVYQQPGQAFVDGQRHSNGRPKHQLPEPAELAGRIEEARTSAKLLIQLVQSTPPAEFDANDLIKEFADRCQSAQRNLQGYMNFTDPAPDESTLQTLIEVCEQLSLASSKHQRAKLAATRQRNSNSQAADKIHSQQPSPNPTATVSPQPQQQMLQPSYPPPSTRSVFSGSTYPPSNPSSDGSYNVQNRPRQSSEGSSRYYAQPVVDRSPALPPGTVELQGNDTPISRQQSAVESGVSSRNSSYPSQPARFSHPRKPVPESMRPTSVDDEDLYASSPMAEINPNLTDPYPSAGNARSLVSDSEAQVHSSSPASTLPSMHQESVTNGLAAHNGFGSMSSLKSQGESNPGRVKDDIPMNPIRGVSGSGWHY